jgi:hypothetical protein
MEMMRELKSLNELARKGALSAEQTQRAQDLKAVLAAQMPRPAAPGHPAAAKPTAKTAATAFALDVPAELLAAATERLAKADEALKANKTRARAKNAEEAVQQLADVTKGNQYTPPELSVGYDEYYSYAEYVRADDAASELPVIDPRVQDMMRMAAASVTEGAQTAAAEVTVTPGGVFLDDYPELYTSGILSAQEAESEEDGEANDPAMLVGAKRKVTVHMLSGEVKRGFIQHMSRQDNGFTLLPLGAGRSEAIGLQHIKAIFVALNPGQEPLPAAGRMVTVTFRDNRSIQGATEDLGQGPSFTLVPPAGKGGFEKIIVNAGACQEVK